MTNIYFDPITTDRERLQELYDGAIFVYQPTETTWEFCSFAAGLISKAVGGLEPETAQHNFQSKNTSKFLKN